MYIKGGHVLQGYSVGILKFVGQTFAMPPGDVGNPTLDLLQSPYLSTLG
jgi:hypothetical protein